MSFCFFKKRAFIRLLVASFVLGIPCTHIEFSYAASESNKNCFVGDNFYSISDSDGTAQFIKSELKEVKIPSEIKYKEKKYKVTSIANNAFKYCEDLLSVSIPNSVKTIGDYAFYGCIKLSDITIPGSVSKIGKYAFYDCNNVNKVIFEGNNLSEIGESAFANCYSLNEIDLPDSVKIFGKDSFKNCES